jgi:hypothetical protein
MRGIYTKEKAKVWTKSEHEGGLFYEGKASFRPKLSSQDSE